MPADRLPEGGAYPGYGTARQPETFGAASRHVGGVSQRRAQQQVFTALFLRRLPSHIRVLLTHEDHSNLRLLGAKADQLVAFGGESSTIPAATEMSQEDLVAALPAKGKQMKGGKQNKRQPPPLPLRPQKDKEKYLTTPATLARDSAGLCYYHWSYGDRANNCSAPCSWQGN